MKRLTFFLALVALTQSTWADYEYGPAQFVTIWDDEEQLFIAKLKNDPPRYKSPCKMLHRRRRLIL